MKVIYSLLAAFAVYEFFMIIKHHKKYPLAEAVAAMTTIFVKKLVMQALFFIGYGNIAFFAYSYRVSTITPEGVTGFIAVYFLVDFLYYWHHRFNHTINFFWIGHSVHHLPNRLTAAAAFQQSLLTAFLTPFAILTIPLAFVGLHPELLFQALIVNLLYQVWTHTEVVGRLGFLEKILNTPAQHRIHHSLLPEHQHKNFGGILCVFDRIFGTYHLDEVKTERFGVANSVEVKHPFTPQFYEIAQWKIFFSSLLKAQGWKKKWEVLTKV